MFGLGLSLTLEDFRRVVVNPRSLITGLFSQMILLPILAFTIAYMTSLPPVLKVGIIIVAVCPGGATSNLITYLLRGNVALAVSMTIVNSLLTMLTVPILVYISLFYFMGMGQTISLPLGPTIVKIFLITLLPTGMGVLTGYFKRNIALQLEKKLRYILPLIYGLIYIMAIYGSKQKNPGELSGEYLSVIPWALLLNLGGMIAGYLFARLMRLKLADQITLTVEVGIQNSALAVTIAGSSLFLNNYQMAIPAVVYGLFTFLTAVIFGYFVKRFSPKYRRGDFPEKI